MPKGRIPATRPTALPSLPFGKRPQNSQPPIHKQLQQSRPTPPSQKSEKGSAPTPESRSPYSPPWTFDFGLWTLPTSTRFLPLPTLPFGKRRQKSQPIASRQPTQIH